MVGLHSDSHPYRDNNIIFFSRRRNSCSMCGCVCVWAHVHVHVDVIYSSFFPVVECVWVTAAALCCHGDSWTWSWGWGFYCSWSRYCCIRRSVTRRYTHRYAPCQAVAALLLECVNICVWWNSSVGTGVTLLALRRQTGKAAEAWEWIFHERYYVREKIYHLGHFTYIIVWVKAYLTYSYSEKKI